MFIVAFSTKSEETTRHASDEVQVNVTLTLFVFVGMKLFKEQRLIAKIHCNRIWLYTIRS